MKVVDPHRPRLFAELFQDCVGEPMVQGAIGVPERLQIGHAVQCHVTKRPEHLARIANVAALRLISAQPDPSESVGVRRRLWRNLDDVSRPNRVSICLAASPCHPGPSEAAQRRIQRRGEPSISTPTDQAVLEPSVLIGFPV